MMVLTQENFAENPPPRATMNSNSPVQKCNCCPYGYHIDLDFVQYCEALARANLKLSEQQIQRRNRRRQRKSMEVLLGIEQFNMLHASLTIPSPVAEQDESIFSNHVINQSRDNETRSRLVSDALSDVCDDFERIFEVSNQRRPSVDGPVNGYSRYSPTSPPQNIQPDINREALHTIREQMAESLRRTKYLEEQNKLIPLLQMQISVLNDEKHKLHAQLRTAQNYTPPILPAAIAAPTRISPVRLSSNVLPVKPSTRDIGCLVSIAMRDVGCGGSPSTVKTKDTGVDPREHVMSHFEVKQAIDLAIHNYKKEIAGRQRSIGIQSMIYRNEKTSATQTTEVIKASTTSIGINVRPLTTDMGTMCHPATKSVSTATSAPSVRTIGTSIDIPISDPVSLRHLNDPSRTPTQRLSCGTQCDIKLANTPHSKTESIGTQTIIPLLNTYNRSVQVTPQVSHYSTDTRDFVTSYDSYTQMDVSATRDSGTNTKPIKLKDTGVSPEPAAITVCKSSNTEKLNVRSVLSGSNDVMINPEKSADECDKPILISKSSNTETKEVRSVLCGTDEVVLSKPLSENQIQHQEVAPQQPSRIPRSTFSSPKVERKLVRQDTYTVPEEIISKINKEETMGDIFLQLTTSEIQEPTVIPKKSDEQFNEAKIQTTACAPVSTNTVSASNAEISKSPYHRDRAIPSKEMLAALKVINDSIQKSTGNNTTTHLRNANSIVQAEWFKISSTDSANPHTVEDYLDCFEEFSSHLLRYVVNISDVNGNTCMHYAVSHGNFDTISILLDSKVCNVNQVNNAGYTCVMLVSLTQLKDSSSRIVVQRLFQMSDVNARAKKHNQTALMLAVSHGNISMVQMLLEAGADINIQDADGSTALMCAAEHGRIDIIKLLLAQTDCNSLVQDADGSTALKISLDAGYHDIGVLLYAHEHMLRNKSPYTSLRRKKINKIPSSDLRSPSSCPASPAPSLKFNFNELKSSFK